MGHLINPITYRVGKTKFWKGVWSNVAKKNYKNFLVEDLNFYKIFKWLLSILNWSKIGISLNDFTMIKNFNYLNICIYFFLKKINLNFNNKKLFYKFSLKSLFIKFFFLKLFYKNSFKTKNILQNFFKKKKKYNYLKKKFFIYKKKRILKFFFKNYVIKKKRKNKARSWFSSFLLKYCFFSFINKRNFFKKSFFLNNSYFFNRAFKKKTLFIFSKKNFLYSSFLQKNSSLKSFNFNFFFRLLSFFLSFFLKNIFQHKTFVFNFFQKNIFYLNANTLKSLIHFSVIKNKSKVAHIVKKIFRKTKKKIFILGLKIGFFGRYEKKLRNKKVWQMRGSLSPSNINSVLSYRTFSVLLKQGLCGLKISFLNKMNKNEIFKKKTFIGRSFKI